jgi:hypothetical protein
MITSPRQFGANSIVVPYSQIAEQLVTQGESYSLREFVTWVLEGTVWPQDIPLLAWHCRKDGSIRLVKGHNKWQKLGVEREDRICLVDYSAICELYDSNQAACREDALRLHVFQEGEIRENGTWEDGRSDILRVLDDQNRLADMVIFACARWKEKEKESVGGVVWALSSMVSIREISPEVLGIGQQGWSALKKLLNEKGNAKTQNKGEPSEEEVRRAVETLARLYPTKVEVAKIFSFKGIVGAHPDFELEWVTRFGYMNKLAARFPPFKEETTEQLLVRIKFPKSFAPLPGSVANGLQFWTKVCGDIDSGVTCGGFLDLFRHTKNVLPGNTDFDEASSERFWRDTLSASKQKECWGKMIELIRQVNSQQSGGDPGITDRKGERVVHNGGGNMPKNLLVIYFE